MYEEGRDFVLPPFFDAIARDRLEPPEPLVILEGEWASARRRANPVLFFPASPGEADVFLFPYDLGPLINFLQPAGCAAFLESLPYLAGREHCHVFADDGDIAEPLPLPVWLLKRSLLTAPALPDPSLPFVFRPPGPRGAGCIATPYGVSAHVLADAPSFDWTGIRYDCSFVGAFSHPYRKAACASLERESGLRFYNGGFDNIEMHGRVFVTRKMPPEEQAERQARFRQVTKASLTVLCPPGVGPQSVRLYETMYYGRVPVLFTHRARYPLEHLIDYERFCFFIAEDAIMDSGRILSGLLRELPAEALHERCTLACKTWNRYFRDAAFVEVCGRMLQDCLALGGRPWEEG